MAVPRGVAVPGMHSALVCSNGFVLTLGGKLPVSPGKEVENLTEMHLL